jgi:hypothetical protein
MQSSTSQSVLIALLAMGLGFSFASTPAIGYPGSGATGAARNPIVSAGGTVSGSSVVPLLLAPPDQDIVITDVVLGARDHGYSCMAQAQVSITDGATVLGSFAIALSTQHSDYTTYDSHVTARLESGMLIRAGMPVELQIHHTGGAYCDGGLMEIDYTVSGYLSQP